MKITKLYLIIVSLVALLASNAIAAAWTGSMSEPENMKKIDGKSFYVITTADELAWFAAQVNGGRSTINAVLGNDIVFGKDKNTISTVQWTPIGKDISHRFDGIFDGANYTIYGMYSIGISLASFIGVLNTNGIVRNLKTNAGYFSGIFRIGGVVAHNNGTIQNVENNNKLEASYKKGDSTAFFIGGIAAHNQGMIISCSNKASVNNTALEARSGGIAGYNTGKIENSGNMLITRYMSIVKLIRGGFAVMDQIRSVMRSIVEISPMVIALLIMAILMELLLRAKQKIPLICKH